MNSAKKKVEVEAVENKKMRAVGRTTTYTTDADEGSREHQSSIDNPAGSHKMEVSESWDTDEGGADGSDQPHVPTGPADNLVEANSSKYLHQARFLLLS